MSVHLCMQLYVYCLYVRVYDNSRELPAVCVMLCHSLVSRLMGDTLLWQPSPLIFWEQKPNKNTQIK